MPNDNIKKWMVANGYEPKAKTYVIRYPKENCEECINFDKTKQLCNEYGPDYSEINTKDCEYYEQKPDCAKCTYFNRVTNRCAKDTYSGNYLTLDATICKHYLTKEYEKEISKIKDKVKELSAEYLKKQAEDAAYSYNDDNIFDDDDIFDPDDVFAVDMDLIKSVKYIQRYIDRKIAEKD